MHKKVLEVIKLCLNPIISLFYPRTAHKTFMGKAASLSDRRLNDKETTSFKAGAFPSGAPFNLFCLG